MDIEVVIEGIPDAQVTTELKRPSAGVQERLPHGPLEPAGRAV